MGLDRSDRANAVAIAGDRVFVAGDSYGPSGYDYAVVAYSLRTGAQEWEARWSGGRGGFNAATSIAASGDRVVVTGQSTAVSTDDGNDTGTVALSASTGTLEWAKSWGRPRHDGFARGLAVAGGVAYVVTLETPIVRYTALSRLGLVAYSVASGDVHWETTLDAALGDALKGSGVAAGGGSVAVVGDYQRSASPLEGPGQDVYDVLTAVFPR